MKPRQQLIEDGIIDEGKITTKHSIALFYKLQLEKFKKLGMGKQTENGVTITPTLIKVTRNRLEDLRPFLRTINRKETNNGTV